MIPSVFFARIEMSDDSFPLPEYQTPGSSGLDLRAFLPIDERKSGHEILPGRRLLVSTGFLIEIPEGFEGQIRPRSGLALKYGVGLVNSPGTIDSDYRGELKILLINFGSNTFKLKHKARIAQLIVSPFAKVKCRLVDVLSASQRDKSGFGSTGSF